MDDKKWLESSHEKAVDKAAERAAEKATERAASYVNIKPRTVHQTRKYLKEKGFDPEAIDHAISQLAEYRYLDDAQFAEMYFKYGFEKGRGVSRIKRELAEKGVSSDIIEQAYEELEDIPDQKEMAKEIAAAVIKDVDISELDYDEKRKLQAKIGRRLMSRGFSSDVVYKVIGEILNE